jgi:hypothetical protein
MIFAHTFVTLADIISFAHTFLSSLLMLSAFAFRFFAWLWAVRFDSLTIKIKMSAGYQIRFHFV